ncbi:MAG TPA: SMP-30/gluconolactonase/LRE family protein [Planctomycetota bacterium]|jgi:sugar lactone lactonase YvrE
MSARTKRLVLIFGIAAAVLGILSRTPLRRLIRPSTHKHEAVKGRFANPEGLAIDAQGNFYVGNQDTGSLVILDRHGKMVKEIASLEGYRNGDGEPGGFCRGLYIVVPEPGRVIQTATHNVVEIDARSETAKLVRIIGSRGAGPGQMDGPEGVSRDVNGDLYVTDEHNRRINVFDAQGRFLRSWSVPQDPQCVTVLGDRVYVSLNKRNYLACYSKDGVERFRIGHEALFPIVLYVTIPAGVVSFALFMILRRKKLALILAAVFAGVGAGGSWADYIRHVGPGEFRVPDGIAVSPDGTELFIVDRYNCRIQVTDLDGHFKREFGRPGRKHGELSDPKQVAFDPEGNVWVADSGNHRLQAFSPDGRFLRVLE